MLTLLIQPVAASLQVGFDNAMKNKSANGSGVGVFYLFMTMVAGLLYTLFIYLAFYFLSHAMDDEIWGYIDLSGIICSFLSTVMECSCMC
jgi:uncharacterized membrane protein YGL010W